MTGAAERLNRIVSLVAELSRRADEDGAGVPLDEIATHFDASVSDIEADVRALTALGESAADDWLLSFGIWQEGDRLGCSSGGPYRRPVRLTPEEVLALRVGLAADPAGAGMLSPALAEALLAAGDDSAPTVAVAPPGCGLDRMSDLLLDAVRDRGRVRLHYLGPDDHQPSERVIHPYRVLAFQDWLYLVAWCQASFGWRRFRLDRIQSAERLAGGFEPRPDDEVAREASTVFSDPESGEVEEVRVRFAPHVARWLAERHPEAERGADGSLTVCYRVAGEDWLQRHILQYGDAAEILSPPGYRRRVLESLL